MSVDSEERDIRLNVPIPANIQPGDTLHITFTAEVPDEDKPDPACNSGIIGSLAERDLPTEKEYDLALSITDRYEDQLDSFGDTTPQYSRDTAPEAHDLPCDDHHGRRRRWSDLAIGNPEYMPRRKGNSVRGNLDSETGALKAKDVDALIDFARKRTIDCEPEDADGCACKS